MTKEEIEQYLDGMDREKLLNMVSEHNILKQHLCAQILLIPTGADDWVDRALHKARTLRVCERQFLKVVAEGEELLASAKWEVRETTCTNCMGSGVVRSDSCVICRGTGARRF